MNLIDCYVTKVLGEPVWHDYPELPNKGWWTVLVTFDSYGRESDTNLSFKTLEEAQNVAVGYHFLS